MDIIAVYLRMLICILSLISYRYGQTGSGKTFTMEGPPETFQGQPSQAATNELRGVIPRTVEQIFRYKDTMKELGWDYQLHASCIEVFFFFFFFLQF